jgi:hypothetical protein
MHSASALYVRAGGAFLKQCTNRRGNLGDFVPLCPYGGVSQPVPQMAMARQEWAPPEKQQQSDCQPGVRRVAFVRSGVHCGHKIGTRMRINLLR